MKIILQHPQKLMLPLYPLLAAILFATMIRANAQNAKQVGGQRLAASSPVSEGLQMTATVVSQQPNPKVGDALILDLAVKNVLNTNVGFTITGAVFNDFNVEMENVHGKPVPLTSYGRLTKDTHKYGVYHMNTMTPLEAGQTEHFYVWLNKVYDLSLSGRYTIHAKYDAVRLDGKGSTPLLTNDVSVNISPTSDSDVVASILKK